MSLTAGKLKGGKVDGTASAFVNQMKARLFLIRINIFFITPTVNFKVGSILYPMMRDHPSQSILSYVKENLTFNLLLPNFTYRYVLGEMGRPDLLPNVSRKLFVFQN